MSRVTSWVGVVGADRVPVDTMGGDGDLENQGLDGELDAVIGRSSVSECANHLMVSGNPEGQEKQAERFDRVGLFEWQRRRDLDCEPLLLCDSDARHGAVP